MNNIFKKATFLLLLFITFQRISYSQSTQNILLGELHSGKTDPSSKYQVNLIVDTVQNGGGNGLKFVLVVKNISGKAVQIENPISNISFALMNKLGESVNLIEINSKIINGKRERILPESFEIEKLLINGKKSDQLRDTSVYVLLNAGDMIEAHLRIKQIYKSKSPKPHIESQKIQISSDRYTLFVNLIIMEVLQKNTLNPILFSGKMIPINFK
ncbi:MAG: hypothetical protein V4450_17910 [Bacteroidota bacterium]